jgi:lysophospholipase L1-like esterase
MKSNFRMMMGRGLVLTVLVAPLFAASTSRYLALGDSISFGYHPLPPPPQPIQSYIGYPEILDPLVPKQEINLSCPGQTSASFLYGSAASATEVPGANCESISTAFPGWKASLPLHNSYTGTQADYAVSQLLNNKSIDLVTISIGGDDLLFVQYMCGGPANPNFVACVQGALLDPKGALFAYGNNLGIILARIRTEAKYTGTVVLVKYFATSTDPLVKQAVGALNQVMAQVGSQFGAKVADAYTAFQIASIAYGGDPCKAGLLVRLSPTTCDVHPTPLGQSVLATTVLIAIFSK